MNHFILFRPQSFLRVALSPLAASLSFPAGTEQKRLLASSSKDELKYITPGVGTVIWGRAE